MSRISRDKMFIDIAKIVAQRGTCDRARVGAVLVRDSRIISIGYNGAPSGEPHCDEVGHHMVEGHCIRTKHAEANCIDWAMQHDTRHNRYPHTLYCTHFPCKDCVRRIIESLLNIDRVVYLNDYRSDIRLSEELAERGIKIERYTEEPME